MSKVPRHNKAHSDPTSYDIHRRALERGLRDLIRVFQRPRA